VQLIQYRQINLSIHLFKFHYGFTTVRGMKYNSQHGCDETVEGRMVLHRKCCFPNCTQSWWMK